MAGKSPNPAGKSPYLAGSFESIIPHLEGGKSVVVAFFHSFGWFDLGQGQLISQMSGLRIMAEAKPEPGWKKAVAVGKERRNSALYQKISPSRQFPYRSDHHPHCTWLETMNQLTGTSLFCVSITIDVRNESRSLADLNLSVTRSRTPQHYESRRTKPASGVR
jgi:hypothetical protein